MPSPPAGYRELDLIVHEFLHVHNEHARASADSVRRKLRARVLELRERFERELTASVQDEPLREAWREHMNQRAPAPAEPPPVPLILFRGRSEAGSEVIVYEAQAGGLRVEVDGTLVHRVVRLDLRHQEGAWVFHRDDLGDFRETLVASAEGLEALRAWVDDPTGEPPWQHLRELAADGLVDRHFALTSRGRRALGRAAP